MGPRSATSRDRASTTSLTTLPRTISGCLTFSVGTASPDAASPRSRSLTVPFFSDDRDKLKTYTEGNGHDSQTCVAPLLEKRGNQDRIRTVHGARDSLDSFI